MRRLSILSGLFAMLPVTAVYAAPETQPFTSAPPVNSVVLVLPIAPPADPNMKWVAQGIQQDLVADLTQLTTARVVAPTGARPALDEQSALDQGRQFDAGFVLFGQSQVSNGQLRVTGQLMDTSTARPLAAVKATAPTDNLFPLEDSLAAQTAQALPPPLGMARVAPATQPAYASAEPPAGSPYTSEPLPTTADPQQQYSQAPQSQAPQTQVPPEQSYIPAGDSPYYSYTESAPPVYYQYNNYYVPYYWGYPYGSYYPYVGVGVGFGYWGGYGRPWYHPYYGYRYGYRGGYYGGYRGGLRGPYYPARGGFGGARGFSGHAGGAIHR